MAQSLDIDLLRSFATVAETGALSRAAERVGRSQAALSMQMKRLEDLVAQPLLRRTGRGVVLTVQGERLLVHARRILASHDDAVAELSGGRLNGTLRFGCPDDYAQAFLPALLRGFARLHPDAAIEVVCAATPRLEDRLGRGGLDLALVSVPLTAGREILRREDLVWVAPRGAASGHMSWPLDALPHVPARAMLAGLKHFRHRRHEVLVMHVLDPAELEFPFQQTTLFRGLEQWPEALAEPRAIRKAYLEEFQGFLHRVKRGCRAHRIDYVQLRTDQSLEVALSNYLASRKQ